MYIKVYVKDKRYVSVRNRTWYFIGVYVITSEQQIRTLKLQATESKSFI